MSGRLHVRDLAYGTTEGQLRRLFEWHGTVRSVTIVTEREAESSTRLGVVEMESDSQARPAIAALHGQWVNGRRLKVTEASRNEEEATREGARAGRSPRPARRRQQDRGQIGPTM